MKEHYGFSDKDMKDLEQKGITVSDLYYAVKEFCAETTEVNKIHLYYYADKHGDFLEGKTKNDIIAQTVFNRLDIKDKMQVAEYIEFLEETK